MKYLYIFYLQLFLCINVFAQFEINPYLGVNFSKTTSNPDNLIKTNNRLGYNMGIELSYTKKIIILTGLELNTNRIIYEKNLNITTLKSEILLTNCKLKLMTGYNLTDDKLFKMKIFLGPTLDNFIRKNDDGNNFMIATDFNNYSINADLLLIMQIWLFYADIGYSRGFTKAFSNTIYNSDSRYERIFINFGLNFLKSKINN